MRWPLPEAKRMHPNYIDRQWLACCDGWASILCKDLRELLHTWLTQDHDVQFILRAPPWSQGLSCRPPQMCTKCCLYYVSNRKRYDLRMLAVQQDGYAIEWIPQNEQTKELCLAAVRQNGLALESVRAQTKLICRVACAQNPEARMYIISRRYNTPALRPRV